MNTLIRNGKVVTATDTIAADVLISGEVIQEVRPGIPAPSDAKIIDAAGMYVLPGGIDCHTHLDDRRVHYVGEVAGVDKQQLFANAAVLLMPIRWREPFGMVTVEALACGTPVIAFAEGAATEIVIEGENGMLVADEAEMARAIGEVDSIDPLRCRSSVAERYDVAVSAAGYERAYRQAIDACYERGISPPDRKSTRL